MNYSEKQLQIINTTDPKVVVLSAAASGKTHLLVGRVKHLLDAGEEAKKVVVITFTNAAAEEIMERLNRPTGLFVGTIHSYANYLLLSSGVDTKDYLEDERFDELFRLVTEHPYCIQEVKHLLLDEAQDTDLQQFEFLQEYVKPANFMYVGDVRQSIYRWRAAQPEKLIEVTEEPDVITFDLNENYRNGSDILQFAKSLIQQAGYEYMDTSIAMREDRGKVISIEYSADGIARTIAKYGNFGKWFILTRTNQQIEDMCYVLKKYKVPYDTFKRSELNNKELNEKMRENTVKVLTIHTSKGLEADNVVVIGAKGYNLEEKCIAYVAATRAKDLLVWTRPPAKKGYHNYKGMTNWEKQNGFLKILGKVHRMEEVSVY